MREGWRILNILVGEISLQCMNMVYLLNGFTWLMIALDCDLNADKLEENQEEEFGSLERYMR